MFIRDLKKGNKINNFFLVKEKNIKEAINGKYLDLILKDKTGEISAKIWKCDIEQYKYIKRGIVLKIKGSVEEYRNILQINIIDIVSNENLNTIKNKNDFIPCSFYLPKEMYEKILKIVNDFNNYSFKKIVTRRLMETKEKLIYYPAAKTIHHNFHGGLLTHIINMLNIAEKLIIIFPFLNKELLFSGIILHDLSKTEEMDADEIGVIDYSIQGKLIGHISLELINIARIGKEENIDKEIIIILEHLILSHHNFPEHGSPKQPSLPEAEMLYLIDNMDSKMNQYEKIYKELNEGEFFKKIFFLDNKNIYKPKM